MMEESPILLKKEITIQQPSKLIFGNGSSIDCVNDLVVKNKKKIFIVIPSSVQPHISPLIASLEANDMTVYLWTPDDKEPTIKMFQETLKKAIKFKADAVLGIGGGSVLDIAKLVAALINNSQDIREVIGIGNLKGRSTLLICMPTTSGTGSEISPNAILLDEEENLKKGVISPFLMPDITYVDPSLTKTVPPSVTAATGIDALTHCIEAFTNKFAHPMVDLYALEGIRLIANSLETAVKDGGNMDARSQMALGSMYGGICLGPVNTAAVHALSYPLGSRFHIPHGVSNAILLPHVMEFNLEKSPDRYARIAELLGVDPEEKDTTEKAKMGVKKVFQLMDNCDIPRHMAELEIPENAISSMAEAAMSVTRLLKNNIRKVTREDAERIYTAAY